MSRTVRIGGLFSAGSLRPPRVIVRRSGNWSLQAALDRSGLGPVAGVDEAGRGACAGPLVVAACVLRPGDAARLDGLTDSKLLTPAERDRYFDLVVRRAMARSVVIVPAAEVDGLGVHVANIEGMRRAVAGLSAHPGYVLTDGFRVPGLTAPACAVVGGDRAAACVAAASILAKVTRDRIMAAMHGDLPQYGFDEHKGYCTAAHSRALEAYGPSPQHRFSFVNVATAAARHGIIPPRRVARPIHLDTLVQNGLSAVPSAAADDVDDAACEPAAV